MYKDREKQLQNRKKHYKENKQYYLDKARRNKETVTKRNFEHIDKYLSEHPCVDCGETDPIVLEFDHVTGTKEANIASLYNCSLERLQKEIGKCEVRCANCHKRITAKRGNFRKYKMSHSFKG